MTEKEMVKLVATVWNLSDRKGAAVVAESLHLIYGDWVTVASLMKQAVNYDWKSPRREN